MKKKIIIKVKNPPPRTGHHTWKSGAQTTHDNRPKRLRTRDSQKKVWERE